MMLPVACALVLALTAGEPAHAAEPAKSPVGTEAVVPTAPVRVDGAVLFRVRGISALPAEERAGAIAGRIVALAADAAVKADSIITVESEQSTDIAAGDRTIMSVHDLDGALENIPRQVLAKFYAAKVRGSLAAYRRDRSPEGLLKATLMALGATLALVLLLPLIWRGHRKIATLLEARIASRLRVLQQKSHHVFQTETVWNGIRAALGAVRTILVLLLLLSYCELVLSLFPWTRAYAMPALELVTEPLRDMGVAVLAYLPKLAFLVILIFLVRFGLRLLRAIFLGIEQGRITFSGFEADWAMPTYKIVRVAVVAFTVVVAYPYIPGSETPAFKGISVFLGVVLSLGSSSSIATIIAGYMLIFRRTFKVGDRVKIGSQIGDVLGVRLQATHLRTIKNEEVVVPNTLILSTEVVNYSSLARQGSLILHTAVTIGYDTPWRQVHAMLLLAAERTPGLLREPPPFVLQTALNDFYVSYELNCHTDQPREMVTIYSDLHRNIQDAFNEFGVQIMSPHYLGDPAKAKIVPRERWYSAPAKPEP